MTIANDCYMRLYSFDGELLNTLPDAHSSLIYDIIVLSTGEVVTSSEGK
jgi:hypothetical protein